MGFDVAKGILTFIAALSMGFTGVMLIWWVVLGLTRSPNVEKRKKVAIAIVIAFVLGIAAGIAHFAVAIAQYS